MSSPSGRSPQPFTTFLIGPPLETRALAHQTVSKPVGLAVFASDALSSTAYATEEILLILALAGLGPALGLSLPIALAIAVLLVIVTVSYRQTIFAYPNGGGAYIVARDNLGELAAQVAGAALLTDYILTVAVSVSAGVAQIASAFPVLLEYRVYLALAVITAITILNLRGVKESGVVFAIPTYFFLGSMFLMLGVSAFRYATGTLGEVSHVDLIHTTLQPLTVFLLLRAFSSGCTALTGIEAISNGITAFKEPRSRNAATTLIWMSTILIILFLSITFVAHQIGALPSHTETVISQIARTVYGADSILYLMTVAGTTLILLMAANTSYADFPRLAALQAGDGFLPRQLTFRGSRLVFSWGILSLALFAAALVVLTGASVSALIPLYAVGVFMSFTLSQAGMVIHLGKIGKLKPGEVVKGLEADMTYDPLWRLKQVISAVGASVTGVVMLIFAVTKFLSGAWLVVLLIPALVVIFFRIHRHYRSVAKSLRMRVQSADIRAHSVETVILIDNIHAGTVELVNFARSLGHPWRAVHIGVNPEKADLIAQRWTEFDSEDGALEVIPSPYRHLAAPIREYVKGLLDKNPDSYVHVIMGHLSMPSFLGQVLHQNSAFIFNVALTRLERVVVSIVPYHIEEETQVNG